ncbi:MAG: hypothetical protein ACI85U_003571, partial [Candidatus Promineifilaceae bacterium]
DSLLNYPKTLYKGHFSDTLTALCLINPNLSTLFGTNETYA